MNKFSYDITNFKLPTKVTNQINQQQHVTDDEKNLINLSYDTITLCKDNNNQHVGIYLNNGNNDFNDFIIVAPLVDNTNCNNLKTNQNSLVQPIIDVLVTNHILNMVTQHRFSLNTKILTINSHFNFDVNDPNEVEFINNFLNA